MRSSRIASIEPPLRIEIEIPEPIGGIAEQHRADETAIGDDELLVDAEALIPEARSARCPRAPMKSPAENTVTPETFRLVARTLP